MDHFIRFSKMKKGYKLLHDHYILEVYISVIYQQKHFGMSAYKVRYYCNASYSSFFFQTYLYRKILNNVNNKHYRDIVYTIIQ